MEILGFLTNINFLQAIILLIGIVLLVFEMFHPGFGLPGILGTILLVAGVVMIAKSFAQALILVVLLLGVLGIALTLILRAAANGKLEHSPLVLKETNQKEEGFIGVEDLSFFLGKEGDCITILRPSGIVDFDGVKIDVVSEGQFIQPGKRVKVIKVESRRIVVKEI